VATTDDIAAASTAIASALASIETQVTILERDAASDTLVFNKNGGPQAAGAFLQRAYLLKVRCDELVRSTS